MNHLRLLIHWPIRHWRGALPLAVAFWIDTVALRLLLSWLQPGLIAWLSGVTALEQRLSVGLAVLFVVDGLILVWQLVGTLRAAERHHSVSGSFALSWATQAASVVIVWLTLADALDGWHDLRATTFEAQPNFVERMDALHASTYRVDIDAGTATLRLSGEIAPGITRRLDQAFASQAISRVVLESDGGNVYEARGLARLFRRYAVTTRIETRCASACTLAFIGGLEREIVDGAALGFHRYRVAADYSIPNVNPAREEARDRDLYRDAGVSVAFVQEMFQADASAMWWPSATELHEAGVVHRIVAY